MHARFVSYSSLGIFLKIWLKISSAIWPRIWRAMGPPQNGQVDLKSKKVGVVSFDKVTVKSVLNCSIIEVLLSFRCTLIEEIGVLVSDPKLIILYYKIAVYAFELNVTKN